MSANTKIFLNQHVKIKDVFDLITKIAGNEFKFKSHSSGINIKEPASECNPWHLEAAKNKENNIVPPKKIENTSPACDFFFVDIIGNQYAATYYFESYSNEYVQNNEKIISTSSSCFWGALGKRLVDFFGGKVIFCDNADSDNPDNWYVCDNPKHPAKKHTQSANDYFFQHMNALNTENILTIKEIKDLESKCAYWSDNDSDLCKYLEKYEQATQLENELPKKKKQSLINPFKV